MSASDFQNPSPVIFESLRYLALFISKILWRIEYHGIENIPQNLQSGLIIAANHQTYIDPVWITLPVRRNLRYMAWDEVFNWFFVGKLIRYLGAFPVKTKGDTKANLEALKKTLKLLSEGATLVIFPEAERALTDGEFLPFRPGAVRIAMETGVPILPVSICGGNKIWAKGMKYPRFRGKIKITFHPILKISEPEKKEDLHNHLNKMTEQLAEIIRSAV